MILIPRHALLEVRLSKLRDQTTAVEDFRHVLGQITSLLAAEMGREIATLPAWVETPLERCEGSHLAKPVVLVPILRAGLGMVPGFLDVFPEATVGHIGMARDEATLLPSIYSRKLPPTTAHATVFILDPMLATGNSAVAAIDIVKETKCTDITLVSCLAAPEGLQQVASSRPDVRICVAAVDRQLNQRGFILPGLGDAGDRQFGT